MRGMKKFLAFALALVLVLSLMPMPAMAAETDTTVYLLPNGNWTQGDAWFAAYYFGSGDGWVKLTGPDANGYYKGTIPAGYDGLIFTRMNPASSALSWDSKWDQTVDLSTPITGNVYFAVNDGEWNNAAGSWAAGPKVSTYTVAGSSGLCGENWDPTVPSNDLELKNGLWTKTYTAVPAGTYEFKVVKDHAWGSEWPASNYVLELTETSDVVITFNRATGEVKATVAVPVSGIALNQTAAAMKAGESMTLTAVVTPDNASDKTVTWTSSNDSVASVEDGVVTAKAAGTATITAAAGGFSATCQVSVAADVASVTIGGVTTNYSSLQAAFNAVKSCTAADNAVVKVLSDVTYNGTLEVEGGVFTLDLGTATINCTDSSAITFRGGDVVITGNGKVIGSMAFGIPNKNAKVTINGGTFEATNSSAISSSGHLTVNGGTIRGHMAAYNQGITVSKGSLTINGGTIEGYDSALYLYNCQVSITGGNINGITAAVSHNDNKYSDGTISISGGSFTGATEMFDGCFGSLGRLPVMTGGSFPGGLVTGSRSGAFPVNDLLAEGYAFWQNGVMLTLADDVTSIEGAVEIKRAEVYVASVTINGVTTNYSSLQKAFNVVKSCTAADNAVVKVLSDVTVDGAQEVESGVFTLDLGTATITSPSSVAILFRGGNVEITGNGKVIGSMAISLPGSGANVTISGGTFESNSGTAIMSSGNLTVNGGTIRSASGSWNQGISATGGSLTVNGGSIYGGEAGLYLFGTQVSITGGTISGGSMAVSHNDNKYSSGTISISGGSFEGATEMFDGCFGSLGRLPVMTGGSFPGGLVTGSRSGAFPVNDLLAEGYAFWQDGKMLTLADDVTSIEGAVEIKPACKHEGGAYTVEGSTVSYECAECGLAAEAKLIAPENLTYNGEEKSVTVESTFEELPQVTYVGDRKNVGTFTAKLTVAEGVEAELKVTITPAKLTIESIEVADKVYDGNQTAFVSGVTVSGIFDSDEVLVRTAATFADKNVGENKAVNVICLLDGTDAGNYTIDNGTATASITPAVITVTSAFAASKTYDGNTNAAIISINVTGVVIGDDVAVKGAGQFADKEVGKDKKVSVTFSLTGEDAGNYVLAKTTGSTTASINNPKDPSSPSTGDNSNVMLWAAMMILSITGAAALVIGKKRYI